MSLVLFNGVLLVSIVVTQMSWTPSTLAALFAAALVPANLVAAVLTVTNTADSGPGTLRGALAGAANGDTIEFGVTGTITLTNGELFVSNSVSILGPGPTNLAVDGNHASRVFHIGSNTVVSISGLTITNGSAHSFFTSGLGGGIFNDHAILTVSDCTLSGNSAFSGGGIGNEGSGGSAGLQLVNSTLSGNSAGANGGCIYNCGGSHGRVSMKITGCTLIVNPAFSGGVIKIVTDGGILNCADNGSANMDIDNSTLSADDNPANLFGGIRNLATSGGSATLQILNTTLNHAPLANGLGFLNAGSNASVAIGSSILNAATSIPSLQNGSRFLHDAGTVISLGYNLSSDGGGSFLTEPGDRINTDPMLGPLQDNGGPTFTHAPACNSPAIDHGKNLRAFGADQRGIGFLRTFDGLMVPNALGGDGTDIGAFELQVVCDHPPVADASATVSLVISPDGTNASVILDGSRSSDPDSDPLQYIWYEDGILLGSDVVAIVVLPVGTHSVQLVVNDGLLSATNAITIEVITTAEAMERLIADVSLNAPRPPPLQAILGSALDSIHRSNPVAAVNELLAFESEVRAQVSSLDSALADTYIDSAEDIIHALSAGTNNPGRRPHGRIIPLTEQSSGRVQMQFTGDPARRYIVEASTNLVDWHIIGVVTSQTDGSFTFEDPQAKSFGQRFYRILLP
jgi:hypothetical protein